MKNIILLLVLFLLIIAYGCKKKCQPVDDKLLSWAHYINPDEIVYTNQFKDTILFHLDYENKSLGYKMVNDLSSPCHSFVVYSAHGNSHQGISFIIEKTKQTVCFSIGMYYYIDSAYKSGYVKTFFRNINKEIQASSINGISYKETLIMEKDTNNYIHGEEYSKDVWKCIVVKDHGLMQFYEQSGVVWTLVE
jgi:hypothetical protein